jgi:hypothetical protein
MANKTSLSIVESGRERRPAPLSFRRSLNTLARGSVSRANYTVIFGPNGKTGGVQVGLTIRGGASAANRQPTRTETARKTVQF